MDLKTPLYNIPGIGPSFAKRLERLELFNVGDLITHYPFRYDDLSHTSTVAEAQVGEKVTLTGELWSISNVYTRNRKILTKALLNDGGGTVELVWFNQPWLTKTLKSGDRIRVAGKVDKYHAKVSLVSPVWEKAPEVQMESLHTGRLVPVYPETANVSSRWIRQKMSLVLPVMLPKISDPLPDIIKKDKLSLSESLEQVHFPDNGEKLEKARQRLSFDELFYLQLATQKKRLEWQKQQVVEPLRIDRKRLEEFIQSLPFELTGAQLRVLEEIIKDLGKTQPMNRLVQGEVGSGKTVVAALAAYLVHLNGLKVTLMAPTEILAFQHFETFSRLLSPLGIEIGLYTGSRKAANTGSSIIIGTHALLSEKLSLENVGLVIVDEQQRFGVEQRTVLRKKAKVPHFLTMTATPIPRTVALTLYGDLDLSIIDELPKGRKIVRTHFVPSEKRDDGYKFISDQVKQGFQVYIITPLIEESETNLSAKAAKTEYERLQTKIFPDLHLGLLHGKLKAKEKEQVINDFKNHKIDILVSTSVVEVGVDVTNATIMVIEGAERFGLAQLHQLRGRVGRGLVQSYTFLFSEQENPEIVQRLKNLETIHEGLELSELDLKIRGSGEVFGLRQSGRWNLKIANFFDLKLIEEAKKSAALLLNLDPTLDKYPEIRGKLSDLASDVMPD